MQWALPNKYSCVIPQESRYEILPWHQVSLITAIITTPPLHTPAPCNHWSDFYPSSFMFSKMFYEWNHTACRPLYWLLSPGIIFFKFIHVVPYISRSFLSIAEEYILLCGRTTIDLFTSWWSSWLFPIFCDYEYSCYICEQVTEWICTFISLR